jgi:hypothetical protein
MTAAGSVAIGQPQAGLLLFDPSSRGLLRASGAGKKHVAVCAAADYKSGLDRPQRLTSYESRPGGSVGRLAVVTAELFSIPRFGVAIPRALASLFLDCARAGTPGKRRSARRLLLFLR